MLALLVAVLGGSPGSEAKGRGSSSWRRFPGRRRGRRNVEGEWTPRGRAHARMRLHLRAAYWRRTAASIETGVNSGSMGIYGKKKKTHAFVDIFETITFLDEFWRFFLPPKRNHMRAFGTKDKVFTFNFSRKYKIMLGPCLVSKKFCKIFQILRHIESLNACMEY